MSRTNRGGAWAWLAAALLLAGPSGRPSALASGPATAAAATTRAVLLRRCVVEFEQAASIGTATAGVVGECLVEPGDRVKRGQVLGRLRDDQARAELELRSAEARDDVEVRLNEAKRAHAMGRLRVSESLRSRGALSREELNLQRLEVEAATLAVEQARRRFDLARLQKVKAEAAVLALEFVSPHDGVVAAVLKQPGEPVTPLEPVFRVVNTDRVRVVGRLDVRDAWRVRAGDPVRVVPEVAGADLAVEREEFQGRVVMVDDALDPKTRTCTIFARVSNRGGLLRSGLEARMELTPGRESAADPATPGAAPAPAPAAAPRVTTGGGRRRADPPNTARPGAPNAQRRGDRPTAPPT